MQLRYMKNIQEVQDGAAKIVAIAWSNNNMKLAVCTADRVVLLFDDTGEKRDKFREGTKPADSKYGKRSYIVKGLAFSPDSTKLAVAQTDNIVFVYKIGEDFGEKKVICNKFIQTSAVTCIAWPSEGGLVLGCADGKVRVAHCRTNKAQTLYGTDSFVCSIVVNAAGTGILSGHADGSIVRWYVAEDQSARNQGKVVVHSIPPYAMAWTSQHIAVAGPDKKVVFYTQDGMMAQQFDYFRDKTEKEFTVMSVSPSGQALCVGSYDRLRLYSWSARKNLWEENKAKEFKYLYSITAMAWKKDGSRIAIGSLCGGVELLESVLKRSVWKGKFELTYVGPSQVLVKPLVSGARGVILKSIFGYEIEDVRIMGADSYLVAKTPETMLLGDLNRNLLSEIPWANSGGNEKFYFENDNVCMIFNAGELSLVEYGKNEIIGSVRTEFMNPHLISVRINERSQRGVEDSKKLAYLLDLKTIALEDLNFGYSLGQVTHDSKIDWLELNETGRKLLFRDKRSRLNLMDIEGMVKTSILNYCTFVQWVPGSDVVVAQSRDNMCVWYNIDAPERVNMLPIKGDIVDILREEGKTEVVVQEGHHQYSYELDEGLIEFGTAIDDGDFNRAINFLESLDNLAETEAMWRTLAKLSLEGKQLQIAERCYAALGDVSKAKYLRETLNIGEAAAENYGADGFDNPDVWARLYILDKQFRAAEGIFLEQNDIDGAIEMYQRLHMWDEALTLAESKGHPQLELLRESHSRWLLETGQEMRAGQIKEEEGEFMEALNLYLKAGLSVRASKLIQNHESMMTNNDLVSRVISSLVKSEAYEQAGELYEKTGQHDQAMESYTKGEAFARAVELARHYYPNEVVTLEENWGDHLTSNKQLDAAINHYIEAGKTVKALDAAINARQWKKAVQIIQVIDDTSGDLNKYHFKLGQHYASLREYKMAEKFYLSGNLYKHAIEMYNSAGLWEQAHQLASKHLDRDEVSKMYIGQAQELEEQGRFKEAEKLYISVQEPDLAISMYKKQRQYENMMRLVQNYHPDLVQSTHSHLAQELETEGNHKSAESHYIQAADWKAAVHMYRGVDLWEEAYRVAQNNGGPHAAKQVAFLWAKTLGGESAVKLLAKFGILEAGIDYACESYQFEFAFELARTAMKEKVEEIHYKYAMALEDDGKFKEAEQHFVKAKKPKEAVLMYVHNQDWDSAQQVAEQHDVDSVSDVLVGQAKVAFEGKDYGKFESLLLRAQRPELAVKQYKDQGMWSEALRVCKEYIPHRLKSLQEEYEREVGGPASKSSDGLLAQGRQWEESGDYVRAVECYLKIDRSATKDVSLLAAAWTKAAEIAIKFLDSDRAADVANVTGPKLIEIGKFSAAAQLYLGCEMIKEAVDAFIAGEEWAKAKKVAKELEPRLESYVDEKYKYFLKNEVRQGNADKADTLADVDLISALDMYVEQGNWRKALATAQQHGPEVLHKYVAINATQLIKDGNPVGALELYQKYGAPNNRANYNIYKRIGVDMFSAKNLDTAESYSTWAGLRDVYLNIVEAVTESSSQEVSRDFTLLLLISHYYATRCATEQHKQLAEITTKITVSLLRHTDIIPADKAFYEAGVACKNINWDNMAFVFLNRYLDLYEAIEERSLDNLDNTDFADTDIPFEIPLPEEPHLDQSQHEEIKEWVLAVSMDQKVEQQLPIDERMTYEGSLVAAGSHTVSPACVVTGYPVLASRIDFARGMMANKEDWNKLVMASKVVSDPNIQDVLGFISNWCGLGGSALNYSFK